MTGKVSHLKGILCKAFHINFDLCSSDRSLSRAAHHSDEPIVSLLSETRALAISFILRFVAQAVPNGVAASRSDVAFLQPYDAVNVQFQAQD